MYILSFHPGMRVPTKRRSGYSRYAILGSTLRLPTCACRLLEPEQIGSSQDVQGACVRSTARATAEQAAKRCAASEVMEGRTEFGAPPLFCSGLRGRRACASTRQAGRQACSVLVGKQREAGTERPRAARGASGAPGARLPVPRRACVRGGPGRRAGPIVTADEESRTIAGTGTPAATRPVTTVPSRPAVCGRARCHPIATPVSTGTG